MATKTVRSSEVDLYILNFPEHTQILMEELRSLIMETAPEAEEVISYKMPAYKFHGMLVYFAGYNHHIGFYPTGSGIEAFKKEIAGYKHSKGAVQFPLDEPLPLKLIAKMVKFKMKENLEKEAIKKAKKKK